MAQVPRIGQTSSVRTAAVGGQVAAGYASIANAERAEIEEINIETSIGDLPSSLSFNQYTVLPPAKKRGRAEPLGAIFPGIIVGFSALIDAQTKMSESKSVSGRSQKTQSHTEMAAGIRVYEANIINYLQSSNQMGSVKILA